MAARVTIKDIAEAAGVSRQTVTRAMNGMPRISEETRTRILELSAELGYRPSRFAANLARSQKDATIGLVVDSFRNPYYTELTADLLDVARDEGWHVSVWSHEKEPELELLARLASQVDAVVAYFGEPDEARIVEAARGVPVVLLGRTAVEPMLHSVDFDFEGAFRAVVAELGDGGRRRFGLLESKLLDVPYVPSSRRVAYERVMDPESARAVVVTEAATQSVDAGERGVRELMRQYPETDTVIAFSDLMAMGALRGAHALSLSVPGDVAILGIDGLSLGAVTSPALTSLALVNDELLGHVRAVLQVALADPAATPERRFVQPTILRRESA